MIQEVALEGRGLHTGERARVVFRRAEGPVRLVSGGVGARVDELTIAGTTRATSVEACAGRLRVGTVEHCFSALAGLAIREGVHVVVDGPELPLLDGGAARFAEALLAMDLAPALPRCIVRRAGAVEVGASRYEFAPASGTDVEVRVDFGDARLAACARWTGDPRDYVERVAPARTFALDRDLAALLDRGLARHVDPDAVFLVTADGLRHASGRAPAADEPARHKLLDLLGDLYVHGGPPLGRVCAVRPGHSATAVALRLACERGLVVRRNGEPARLDQSG